MSKEPFINSFLSQCESLSIHESWLETSKFDVFDKYFNGKSVIASVEWMHP